jgi:hypothetical protein
MSIAAEHLPLPRRAATAMKNKLPLPLLRVRQRRHGYLCVASPDCGICDTAVLY